VSELTFLEEMQQERPCLARAALQMAREICYPQLEIGEYLDRLTVLSQGARPAVRRADGRLAQARALAEFLFVEQGFLGNAGDYNDPRNSYLNDVIDRRLGIPISLSVIYLELADQLGMAAYGIGLPGHFIVGLSGESGEIYLDPFNGGIGLTVLDCARLVEQSTGYSGPFQAEWLKPVQARYIMARMLYNLRKVYIQKDDWRLARVVLEYLAELQPERADHLRDLGTVHMQMGAYRKAIDCYQRYLRRSPQAEDAELVQRNLAETSQKLARLN
jgi:regulator of sirC expression with transglutaminase-like and TPR domain